MNTEDRDGYNNISFKYELGEELGLPSGVTYEGEVTIRFMQETEAGVDGMTAGYILTNLAGIGFYRTT